MRRSKSVVLALLCCLALTAACGGDDDSEAGSGDDPKSETTKTTEATETTGEDQVQVNEKDVVVVEPNTAHHIETLDLQYVTVTRPDWYFEQFEHVDEA